MEKYNWNVEETFNRKFEASIEKVKYLINSDVAALFHALMCINDTLEELTFELKRKNDNSKK